LAAVYFEKHELDAFFAEAERAIALNPNHALILAANGMRFYQAGDKRGIDLLRKAMKLDPFHPTWSYFPVANYHFERGEYEEALAAARKINLPGIYVVQIFLAAIYAELEREKETRAAVEELLRLRPGFTIEKQIERLQKLNFSEERIRLWVTALRKAGLPE
jgi:adenylate cyclase